MVAVAIERMGCFHFQLMCRGGSTYFPDYIQEKLGLFGSDAVMMAKLLNLTHEVFVNSAILK